MSKLFMQFPVISIMYSVNVQQEQESYLMEDVSMVKLEKNGLFLIVEFKKVS